MRVLLYPFFSPSRINAQVSSSWRLTPVSGRTPTSVGGCWPRDGSLQCWYRPRNSAPIVRTCRTG